MGLPRSPSKARLQAVQVDSLDAQPASNGLAGGVQSAIEPMSHTDFFEPRSTG